MKKISFLIIAFVICIFNSFSIQAQYSWTQKASLTAPNGRKGSTGFAIGHYGFIGTGAVSAGYLDDFWRWNQDSNTWTKVANYPGIGRGYMTSFTIAGKGYCGLGFNGSTLATDLWEYDTTSNTWTPKASFPGAARYQAFAFVIGTKAYIGCGDPDGAPYYDDVWVYDAIANTWTQVANFPGGLRTGLCAFTLNGYGYAGCGGNDVSDFNDLWQYNPGTNTWVSMASLPISGSQLSTPISFVIDTLAYVGTGQNTSTGKFYRDFWSYSATTNTWKPIATLTGVCRWQSVGFSIGNYGYVATGTDSVGDYLPDFWQYGPIAPVANFSENDTLICIGDSVQFNDLSTNSPTGWKWYFENGNPASSTSQNPVIIYNTIGIDSVKLVVKNPSGSDSVTLKKCIHVKNCGTGIENIYSKNIISIYPNPSNGRMILTYTGKISRGRLEIIDLSGRLLNTCDITGSDGLIKINETELGNGMYFYRIIDSSGLISSGKFTIEK